MNPECAQHADLGPRHTAGIPVEVADSIIEQLIAIGFTLASCVDITNAANFARMGQAVADLDRAIDLLNTTRARAGRDEPGASQDQP
jgi:hypothetical protein